MMRGGLNIWKLRRSLGICLGCWAREAVFENSGGVVVDISALLCKVFIGRRLVYVKGYGRGYIWVGLYVIGLVRMV